MKDLLPRDDRPDESFVIDVEIEPASTTLPAHLAGSEPQTGMERFLQPRPGLSTLRVDSMDGVDTGESDRPFTLDTDGIPCNPRDRIIRRWLTRGVPALVLLAVIAWSARELSGMSPAPRALRPTGVIEKKILPELLPPPAPEPTTESASEVPLRGADARLGDSFVERVMSDGTERLALRMLLKHDVVSVVNLWATWCAPCTKELPEFKKLFAANLTSWGEAVRFVPVLVDESKDGVWVSQNYSAHMPATNTFLVDRAVEGIKSTLVDAKFLAANTELPVTLLVDCRQQVRWHTVGALDKTTFAQLTAEIEVIRRELGTDYCRPPRKKVSTVERRPRADSEVSYSSNIKDNPGKSGSKRSAMNLSTTCGNKKCDPEDDCRCSDCPSCKRGTVCTMKTGGSYFCKDEEMM